MEKLNVEIKTVPGGTMTIEGFIRHIKHPKGFYMPVMLEYKDRTVKSMQGLHAPKRRKIDGRLIFALPGGDQWIAGSEYEKALMK